MKKYGKHFAVVIVLIILTSIATYYLLSAIYTLPIAASAEAIPIDTLFDAHFLLIAILFSIIVVPMGVAFVVFRQKDDDDESEGDYFHGNTAIEIAWTVVPLGLVAFFAVWSIQILDTITAPADNEITVRAVGRQWSWFFVYPEHGDFISEELVLPVDQKIHLELESQDVLHSFWVPEFRVKQDLVPGRVLDLRVTPNLTGNYKIRCAEICGLNHSTMLADVRVVTRAEFDIWVAEQQASLPTSAPVVTAPDTAPFFSHLFALIRPLELSSH